MSEKHKKVFTVLNYIEQLLILISTITGCLSISAFPLLIDIPIGITTFALELNFFLITVGIKNYTSTTKNKRQKHDRIVLLARNN